MKRNNKEKWLNALLCAAMVFYFASDIYHSERMRRLHKLEINILTQHQLLLENLYERLGIDGDKDYYTETDYSKGVDI